MKVNPEGPHSLPCEFLTCHSWPTQAPSPSLVLLVDVKLTSGADGSEWGVVDRENLAGLAGGM